MSYMITPLLFVVTALAEIVGCYLPYLWLRQGRSAWLLIPAAFSLAMFAWLLSLHPTAAGRVYAAYGGVYIAVALSWLWLVDGVRPSSSRSAEMSKLCSAPRCTPPIPPVANSRMPAREAACIVVALVTFAAWFFFVDGITALLPAVSVLVIALAVASGWWAGTLRPDTKPALTAALRQRFNVSVSEVDHQDLWQRAAIGASCALVAPPVGMVVSRCLCLCVFVFLCLVTTRHHSLSLVRFRHQLSFDIAPP